ncbi:hypothetical protein LINGRAHAP2_LOCUS17909 [Linum grandiflorum]
MNHTIPPNAWTRNSTKLFANFVEPRGWYVADSYSEDGANAMREEDDVLDGDDSDPLCPFVLFTVEEKISFCRAWRLAFIVKGLRNIRPSSLNSIQPKQ